jgi:hypothetical protein
MRRCSGSKTFGIEAHEAPATDFPIQPSRKDGLGTMCKPHWNQYTSALRKAALARKAEANGPVGPVTSTKETKQPKPATAKPKARRSKVEHPMAHIPPAGASRTRKAKAVVAATDGLGGKAYTDAIASDEVQAALDDAARGLGEESTFESDVRAILA